MKIRLMLSMGVLNIVKSKEGKRLVLLYVMYGFDNKLNASDEKQRNRIVAMKAVLVKRNKVAHLS